MGLANYFGEYVKDFATFAAPLTENLKVGLEEGKKGSKKPVEWDEESKNAFVALKAALAEELMLFKPDMDQPFIVHTDASDFAIGAVLSQRRGDRRVPLDFYSQKLTGSQLNWAPWEKEM